MSAEHSLAVALALLAPGLLTLACGLAFATPLLSIAMGAFALSGAFGAVAAIGFAQRPPDPRPLVRP